MSGIIEDLLPDVDCILGIRDDIGAELRKVFLVKRKWGGETLGDGRAKDTKTQILPTPYIVDFSHNIQIQSGGSFQQGDVLLKNISKDKFPKESDLQPSTGDGTIEYFYEVGDKLYNLQTIVEKHLTWNVQLRRLIDDSSGSAIGTKPDSDDGDGGVIIG